MYRREKRNCQKKDRILERGRKSERTSFHVYHFPDLPGGEITIEGSSIVKHCTTATKKKSKDKNGLEKKRGESNVQK